MAEQTLSPLEGSRQEVFYSWGVERPERQPLEGSQRYDAAVVGGGYAGISAAAEFRREGRSVIVLEKERVAGGASGRNGGILGSSLGPKLGDLETQRRVDEALATAVQEITEVLENGGVDADVRRGEVRLAITNRQAGQLARAAGVSSPEAPATEHYLDRDALREYVRSERYTGGLLCSGILTVNPHQLLEGLAQRAEREGVVIVERSPVRSVDLAGDGAVLRTDDGEVHAERLVVAAGVGTWGVVPRLAGVLMAGYSQIAVTEPIPDAALDEVLPRWQAAAEIASYSRYFRRLPEGRLLFGISSLLLPIPADELQRRIRAELRDTFPSLGDVPFASTWQGEIATTREESPLLERIGPGAVATSSNGVIASWYTGRVAAKATAPEFGHYELVRGFQHRTWPPYRLPDQVARRAAAAVLKLKDRF